MHVNAYPSMNPLESTTWRMGRHEVEQEEELGVVAPGADQAVGGGHHNQEHHSSVDLRRRGGVEWLHELHDWDAGYGAPVDEGGEEDEGALERPQRHPLSVFTHTSEKSLVGLVLVAVSAPANFVVLVLFTAAITRPQFSYMTNNTRVSVYLVGETTGETMFDTTPNPECLREPFRFVLILTIWGAILSLVSLLLLCLSCRCATTPYRFIRPLVLLVSAVLVGVGEYRFFLAYSSGCNLRWYIVESGAWCLYFAPAIGLLLSLLTFAQVSRYPIIDIPRLWGDNNEPTEDDEQAPHGTHETTPPPLALEESNATITHRTTIDENTTSHETTT